MAQSAVPNRARPTPKLWYPATGSCSAPKAGFTTITVLAIAPRFTVRPNESTSRCPASERRRRSSDCATALRRQAPRAVASDSGDGTVEQRLDGVADVGLELLAAAFWRHAANLQLQITHVAG